MIANPDEDAGGTWRSPYPQEFGSDDMRWPHAKLYECTQGSQRRLLVTSANFSGAAWGRQTDGAVCIRNFELGVAFRVDHGLARHLRLEDFVPWADGEADEERIAPDVSWGSAEWNGKRLLIEYRVQRDVKVAPHVSVAIARLRTRRVAVQWRPGSLCRGLAAWSSSLGVPLMVHLDLGHRGTRPVAVVDVRRTDGCGPVCTHVEPNLLEDLLARIAEERYGGRALPEDAGTGEAGEQGADRANGGADYQVAAYADGRWRFGVIDQWRKCLADSAGIAKERAKRDGRRILDYWQRQASHDSQGKGVAIATSVAAEELRRWLRRA
jgi:hypothetical protein